MSLTSNRSVRYNKATAMQEGVKQVLTILESRFTEGVVSPGIQYYIWVYPALGS